MLPQHSKMVSVKKNPEKLTFSFPDLKEQAAVLYPDVFVDYGSYICFRHLLPLPDGVKHHSISHPPKLIPRGDGLDGKEWTKPSLRKPPPERWESCGDIGDDDCIMESVQEVSSSRHKTEILLKSKSPPPKKRKIVKVSFSKQVAVLEEKNLQQEEEIKSLSAKVLSLEKKLSLAPVDHIITLLSSEKEYMSWFGVPKFLNFYLHVYPSLKEKKQGPNKEHCLKRTLIMFRQGFSSRVGTSLMEPHWNHDYLKRMFRHTIKGLFEWAKTEIYLPSISEWICRQTPTLQNLFPNFLFFFIDGTVLEIESPIDVKMN